MSFWDFTRSPASSRLLVEYGRARGLEPAALLKGTALALAQLDDPKAEVSAADELRVVGNLLRLLGHPAQLGIEIGLRYQFSTFGLWGYGLVSSATLGDALTLALRFIPLTYAYTLISYHEEGGLAVLSFGEPNLSSELTRFLVERDVGVAVALLRELGGDDFRLARVSLTGEPPRRAAAGEPGEMRRAVGVLPQWSAKVNSVAFDSAYLTRVLPQANPVTAAMCADMCAELVERRRVRRGVASVVREYLDVPGGGTSDLATMSNALNLSERTLKRRLQEEGTSFRNLLVESRRTRAEEWLGDNRMTIAEIAARLGFSDSSTFSQAFKRWYGESPSAWRNRR